MSEAREEEKDNSSKKPIGNVHTFIVWLTRHHHFLHEHGLE